MKKKKNVSALETVKFTNKMAKIKYEIQNQFHKLGGKHLKSLGRKGACEKEISAQNCT